ncbi:MAG: hypothetical protein HGA47_04175 [Zoogloea sp.]|nr:hypothetical protein [Zoogloea sp.]
MRQALDKAEQRRRKTLADIYRRTRAEMPDENLLDFYVAFAHRALSLATQRELANLDGYVRKFGGTPLFHALTTGDTGDAERDLSRRAGQSVSVGGVETVDSYGQPSAELVALGADGARLFAISAEHLGMAVARLEQLERGGCRPSTAARRRAMAPRFRVIQLQHD